MINKTLIAFKSKEENVAKFAKADQQLREFVCCYFEIYDEKKQTLQNKLSSFFLKQTPHIMTSLITPRPLQVMSEQVRSCVCYTNTK